MRRMLIDTDTASDDALAIIMALRDETVKVEAITVIAGNVPLETGTKNALISIERAGTYQPPVYKGSAKPMMRPLVTAEFVHGDDGMGNMNLSEPSISAQSGHAIDVLIDFIESNPGEMELVTLGPLTNVALAYLKQPSIARKVKKVVIMGGTGAGPGNITPVAEYNFFVDAQAAHIVMHSGMPLTLVGWDASTEKTFITEQDIDYLTSTNSSLADFCVRCNQSLQEHNLIWGKKGFDLPDPVAMFCAIHPERVIRKQKAFVEIEYISNDGYGQSIIDFHGLTKKEPNAEVVLEIDAQAFKSYLFQQITD